MSGKAHITGLAGLLIAVVTLLNAPAPALGAVGVKLAGALEGRVSDDSGKPQMGAVVTVYNRQEKVLDRALTDGEGFFSFAGLAPDFYSIRVTLATFLPAIRNQIQIAAGKSSLLDVNLSGLFSSIRLLPSSRNPNGIANEDWKWVLRSSSATRPVFRYTTPQPSNESSAPMPENTAAVFHDTAGLLLFSAGDSNSGGFLGAMGTAFAFSSSVSGSSSIQFAGDVGYEPTSNAPSGAIRTTYSRDLGASSPQVSVTFRQIYVPRFAAETGPGAPPVPGLPPLRTVSLSTGDTMRLADDLDLQYGFEMDTVAFVDHLHYFSPYTRLTYRLGDGGQLRLTVTSGNARPELADNPGRTSELQQSELQQDVAALGDVPHVTLDGGRTEVQRGEDIEIGYSRKFHSNKSTHLGRVPLGGREVRISAYRENVQNAALMIAGNPGSSFKGDVIPDLYTDSQVFDAGNYHNYGYTMSLAQDLGDNYRVTVMYGSVGVLAPGSGPVGGNTPGSAPGNTPDDLRGFLRAAQRQAVTAQVSGAVQKTGTRFSASYQLMDDRAATSGHLYSTESDQPEIGLNVKVHQPLPAMFGIPLHMEAVMDLQNMLAEGYLPVTFGDGSRVLLVHTPRSLRGGLNFRF